MQAGVAAVGVRAAQPGPGPTPLRTGARTSPAPSHPHRLLSLPWSASRRRHGLAVAVLAVLAVVVTFVTFVTFVTRLPADGLPGESVSAKRVPDGRP
ncbi:hypothetical protein ACFWMG_29445 [Streptomyces sp. NPDC127074]|uniref:hypothetical protein n=1 Tax=Streptomyces sp. NPDC127074 TaxID=3347130 RepID=UPI00366251F6